MLEPPGETFTAWFLPPANEVWGKVKFYTCLSFCSHGGQHPGKSTFKGVYLQGCLPPGVVCLWGVCIHGGLDRPPNEPEKRAVRILLECFLVKIFISVTMWLVVPSTLHTRFSLTRTDHTGPGPARSTRVFRKLISMSYLTTGSYDPDWCL